MSDPRRRRGPGSRWLQQARILRQYVRIGLIRKSQFRVEFLSQVAMDVVWYGSHVLVFEILTDHSEEIAGWTLPDLRVFLGFLFVIDAYMMMWLGQAWHFGAELKDGKLDPIRVRPASPVLLYFFQRFSLEACFNMVLAASYLVWALVERGLPLDLRTAGLVLWGLALGFWARTALTVLFSSAEFYFLHSDLGNLADQAVGAVAQRPLDVFRRRARQFFLLFVPIGALSYLPAALVLGKLGLAQGIFHSTWILLFGWASFRFWRRGFRRYESAMG